MLSVILEQVLIWIYFIGLTNVETTFISNLDLIDC